jgi:hypothetical protein
LHSELIKTGYEFIFRVATPSLMLMMVAIHPDREHTARRCSRMAIQPYIPFEEFSDVHGNRCRDVTRLALTFCRCLWIPARYVTGYLGDIGVPTLLYYGGRRVARN